MVPLPDLSSCSTFDGMCISTCNIRLSSVGKLLEQAHP